MAVTFINSWIGGTSTGGTVPSQRGDIFVAFAFRDGSTIIPTVASGWRTRVSHVGTSCSAIVAFTFATGTTTTINQTFLNASSVVIVQYRGDSPLELASTNTKNAGTAATVTYGGLSGTLPSMPSKRIMFAGHRSTNTGLELVPTTTASITGTVTNIATLSDITDEVAAFDAPMVGSDDFGATYSRSVGGTASGWITFSVIVSETIVDANPLSTITDPLTSGIYFTAINGTYTPTGLVLSPGANAICFVETFFDSYVITYDGSNTTNAGRFIVQDHHGQQLGISLSFSPGTNSYITYTDHTTVVRNTVAFTLPSITGTMSVSFTDNILDVSFDGIPDSVSLSCPDFFTNQTRLFFSFDPTSTGTYTIRDLNPTPEPDILAEEVSFDWINFTDWAAKWNTTEVTGGADLFADRIELYTNPEYPEFFLSSPAYGFPSHISMKTPVTVTTVGTSIAISQVCLYLPTFGISMLEATITSDNRLFVSSIEGFRAAFNSTSASVTDVTPVGGLPQYIRLGLRTAVDTDEVYVAISNNGSTWQDVITVPDAPQGIPVGLALYGGFDQNGYDAASSGTSTFYNLNEVQSSGTTYHVVKVFDGSVFIVGTLKAWNGSSWVDGKTKSYDGSQWTPPG